MAWLAKQVELGLAGQDLSPPQYRTLSILDSGTSLASAVAERLAVRPPSVTSVVDGLEARGLVQRCAADGDRRRVALVLTDAGRAVLAEADATLEARLVGIADAVGDPVERERMLEGLDHWGEALIAYRSLKNQEARS